MSKKLTFERYQEIRCVSIREEWDALQPYIADEQPAEYPTKPEPSRLEVAKDVLLSLLVSPNVSAGTASGLVTFAYQCADELIKESRP